MTLKLGETSVAKNRPSVQDGAKLIVIWVCALPRSAFPALADLSVKAAGFCWCSVSAKSKDVSLRLVGC